MKKKYSLVMFFLCSTQLLFAFDFIDSSLESFIKRIVLQEHQQEFADYYRSFLIKIDSLGKSSLDKKNAELHRLRTRAFYSLENMHPAWAEQLKEFAFFEKSEAAPENEQLKDVRIFLTRYAVYDEFLKDIAKKRSGIWHKVKSYSKHITAKASHWFDGVRGWFGGTKKNIA